MKTKIILSLMIALLLESCAAKPMYYRRGSLGSQDSKNKMAIFETKPMFKNVTNI